MDFDNYTSLGPQVHCLKAKLHAHYDSGVALAVGSHTLYVDSLGL
jgi:hypothetical protein